MNPRVKSVKVLSDYQLLIIFTNDEIGIYDCKPLLNFGVFKELKNIKYFNKVSIVGNTVAWSNEQDICPDTLYLESEKVNELILKFKENASGTLEEISVEITEKEASLFCKDSKYLDKSTDTLIVKENFFIGKKIDDKWRYNLKYDTKNKTSDLITANTSNSVLSSPTVAGEFKNIEKDIPVLGDSNDKVILIILESPHNDEYDDNFEPLSPANGDTGVNFEKHFISCVLPELISLGLDLNPDSEESGELEYKIYFVNPVQYQASLHQIIEKMESSLKAKVWRKLYNACKSDFEERVKKYKPVIIINSGTSGLKDSVTTSINDIVTQFHTCQKFVTSHPSSWKISVNKW